MPRLADRVKDTTTSTGTGTITVADSAPTGYQSFTNAFANGDEVYFVIHGGAEWEVSLGVWDESAKTLTRATVLASSNGGALVNFSSGTKDVFCTFPAAAKRGVSTIASASFPAAQSVDITDIPARFDRIFLLISGASHNSGNHNLMLRWSSDNGSSFYTTGVYGHAQNAVSAVVQLANESTLMRHANIATSSAFTGVIVLDNYSDPNVPLMVDVRGTHDGAAAYSCRSADLLRYNVLNALRIMWDSAVSFDAGTYTLIGVNN